MKNINLFILGLTLSMLFVGCGDRKSSFVVSDTLEKEQNLTKTSKKLETSLKAEGFDYVDTRINKTIANSSSASRPQIITGFENKKYAQMLLVCNPSIGLDLPFKIAIWKNYDGKMQMAYVNPEYLSITHNIKDKACIEIINRTKISIQKAIDSSTK